MRSISLRLDPETDALLRRLCDQTGLTQTDVIKQALELLAKDGVSSPADRARRLGLIGGFAGADADAAMQHSSVLKARLRERRARDERGAASTGRRKANGPVKRP